MNQLRLVQGVATILMASMCVFFLGRLSMSYDALLLYAGATLWLYVSAMVIAVTALLCAIQLMSEANQPRVMCNLVLILLCMMCGWQLPTFVSHVLLLDALQFENAQTIFAIVGTLLGYFATLIPSPTIKSELT